MSIEKHKKVYNQFNQYLNATTGLSIRISFAYSVVAHVLIVFAVMFFVPAVKEKKMGDEFFARLVTPDEFFAKVPFVPPIQKARPPHNVRPRTFTPRSSSSSAVEERIPSSPFSSQSGSPNQGIEGRPEGKMTSQKPGVLSKVPEPSLREKLFDRSIIGELAKREIEKEKKEEKTFGFDVKDLRFSGYLQRLKEKIESIWIYPPDAATKGIYGDLIIEFTIKKNGNLGAVELIRTSGHKNLDDAAIKALRDAEPFWPLPKEWDMEAYSIVGHFVYTIYGYYIR
ncbi:MAG: energy transducer TonB [Nitrospirota bacterium]